MNTRKTRYVLLGLATLLIGVLVGSNRLLAQPTQLSAYNFSSTTGTAYDMSGDTILLGTNVDDGLSVATNIGFTFSIGGVNYTQFKANSNGYMTVGTAATSSGCCGYLLTSLPAADRPAISLFSKDLHNGSDGKVSYKVVGSAPNRILVVHFRTRQYPGSSLATHTTMQARLYETSNKIELYYGETSFTTETGGIGVIVSSSNYAAVNSGVVSNTSASNSTFPALNTLYSFTPCQANVAFVGDLVNGGTSTMKEGDSLLIGKGVMRGSASSFQPFTINNGTKASPACATRTYSYAISGVYGGDYAITPTNGSLKDGGTATPTITFRPSGTGLRPAVLTVTDDAGLRRNFALHGTGLTRVGWSGDITQAGTPNALDGDTLLNRTQVEFGSSRSFRPLIITDINTDKSETPALPVTYELIDPIGNYELTPTTASILGGQRSIPVITFNARGIVGTQEAMLVVTADGERRTYILRAYNAAPGGRLVADRGGEISKGIALFTDRTGCVGAEVMTLKITAENTGAGAFVVRGADFYQTDTAIKQGNPPYALLRDKKGEYIRSNEYFISMNPGVSPLTANARFDSLVVPEGQSRVFYLNVIASRPGKRYGAVFFHTNAFNLEDENLAGVPTRGVLRSGVYARGMGASLATREFSTDRPAPIVFAKTEVRKTSVATSTIRNNGECALYISKSRLRLASGDLTEFRIVSALPNAQVVNGSYMIPPGGSGDITVEFTPNTYGSRRATITLATNDSTLGDGLTSDIGTLSLDVYGVGNIGLEALGAKLPPAVIDAESSFGFVQIENTSAINVVVTSIVLEGDTEITQDPARPWQAAPITIPPANGAKLWVKMTGDAANGVGNRASEMVLTLNTGEVVRVPITGYVGSRTIAVLQSSLFSGMEVNVGEVVRRYVAVTNTGSLPVRLNAPVLTASRPGDYTIGGLARRVLEPGQTEFLEVTWAPQSAGPSSGTITFSGNGTNGDQTVMLGGMGAGTGRLSDPSGSSIHTPGDPFAVASSKTTVASGLALAAVSPNPVRSNATVSYEVAEAGSVTINLYDASGRVVATLLSGDLDAGAGTLQLDVTGLPTGTYHIVLRQGEEMTTTPVRVVR